MSPLKADSRILGIIPARGGSKGIPRKNLVDVCGKPLIAWSIACANDLVGKRVIARSIVSTDDCEIADVSREYQADVPFLRPSEIAGDGSKTIECVLHALDFMQERGEGYDAVLLLQPTSPLRDVADIGRAVERFIAADALSLISCYEEDYVCEAVMYREWEGDRLRPVSQSHNRGVPRQNHGPTWVRNGAVYLTRTEYLRDHRRFICDRPLLMKMRKSDSINVNCADDLVLLRARLCESAS